MIKALYFPSFPWPLYLICRKKICLVRIIGYEANVKDAIMIGDTDFDVLGAKEHAIPCIGVNWGYGNKKSMIEAGAVTVVDTVEQLEEYLKNA